MPKNVIAHGVVEFSEAGLRQITQDAEKAFKHIASVTRKRGKNGFTVSREEASMALAFISKTTKGYRSLEALFKSTTDDIRTTAAVMKELNSPELKKVIGTYMRMGDSLSSVRKELEFINRLQENVVVGGGLSYGYMRGVPQRAEAIKERQIQRGRSRDDLMLSMKARYSEVDQVLGPGTGATSGDVQSEYARVARDEFKRAMDAATEGLRQRKFGFKESELGMKVAHGTISGADFMYQMRSNAAQEEYTKRAQKTMLSEGTRMMSAAIPAKNLMVNLFESIESAVPSTAADSAGVRLRMLGVAVEEVANTIEQRARDLASVKFDVEAKRVHTEFETGQIGEDEFVKRVKSIGLRKRAEASREEYVSGVQETVSSEGIRSIGEAIPARELASRLSERIDMIVPKNSVENLEARMRMMGVAVGAVSSAIEQRARNLASAKLDAEASRVYAEFESGQIDESEFSSQIKGIGLQRRADASREGYVSGVQEKVTAEGMRSIGSMIPARELASRLVDQIDMIVPEGSAENLESRMRMMGSAVEEVTAAIEQRAKSLLTGKFDEEAAGLMARYQSGEISDVEFRKESEAIDLRKRATLSAEREILDLQTPQDEGDRGVAFAEARQKALEEAYGKTGTISRDEQRYMESGISQARERIAELEPKLEKIRTVRQDILDGLDRDIAEAKQKAAAFEAAASAAGLTTTPAAEHEKQKVGELEEERGKQKTKYDEHESAVSREIEDKKKLISVSNEQIRTSRELTDEEDSRWQASMKAADANVVNANKAKELDGQLKGLKTRQAGLVVEIARSGKATRGQTREYERLSEEISNLQWRINALSGDVNNSNMSLHQGAMSSRRYNYMLQQASYGVQDFVQVIGQTGLAGALRASANNMASLFGAMGTTGGALAGAGITILFIGIAEAAKSLGIETESLTEKIEKLSESLDLLAKSRERMELGRIDISADKGLEASISPRDVISESFNIDTLTRRQSDVMDEVIKDYLGGTTGALWDTLIGSYSGLDQLIKEFVPSEEGPGLVDAVAEDPGSDLAVTQVAIAKLRGDGGIGEQIINQQHRRIKKLREEGKVLDEYDAEIERLLRLDMNEVDQRRKALDVVKEKGKLSAEQERELHKADMAVREANAKMKDMIALSKEQTEKLKENARLFGQAAYVSVASGSTEAFDSLSKSIANTTQKIEQFESELKKTSLTPQQREYYEEGVRGLEGARTALKGTFSSLVKDFGKLRPKTDAGRDLSSGLAGIIQEQLTSGAGAEGDQAAAMKASNLIESYLEQSRGKSGRQFGKTKQQSIADMRSELASLEATLMKQGGSVGGNYAQMLQVAADRLANIMELTSDKFEQMSKETDLFIKNMKRSNQVSIGGESAFKNASEYAAKAMEHQEQLSKVQADIASGKMDPEALKEARIEESSLIGEIRKLGTQAAVELSAGGGVGTSGFVEDAAAKLSELLKSAQDIQQVTGAPTSEIQSYTRKIAEQFLHELTRGGAQVEQRFGETEDEARNRALGDIDRMVTQLPAFLQDIARTWGAGIANQWNEPSQATSVTSAESLWQSIQSSLMPGSDEKKKMKAAQETSKNTSSLKKLYNTPIPVVIKVP